MTIDDFFEENAKKNDNGTLTVKDALLGGYYRLREGEHAGRVIIKSSGKIDNKNICLFARNLTWVFEDKIKDILCERVSPTFSQGKHPIDRSKASWYGDGSFEKSFYND